MGLRMRRSSLGFLDTNALRTTSDAIRMVAWRRGSWFIRRRSPASWGCDATWGVRGSHAIA